MLAADVVAGNRLDAFTEQADYAVVGPKDNRVQLIATTRYPFNTICHLARDFGDGRLRGCTGVLIAPRFVLTAAHCLFNLVLRRAPQRILIMPGRRDRDTLPFGFSLASRAYVARNFLARPRNYDYGLVELPSPFRGLDRFMPLRPVSDSRTSGSASTSLAASLRAPTGGIRSQIPSTGETSIRLAETSSAISTPA